MGWLLNLYSRIMPASKNQGNVIINKLNELEDKDKKQLEKLERHLSYNIYGRLDRIERLLEMGCSGITKEKRPVQIVVSMTSYEKRIAKVPLVLERLFNQTVRPDRIILYLSEDNFPEKELSLPQRLLDFTELGLELRWCKGDIKSYKKLIPALQEFPDDIVITVDDDMYYELDIVEKLYDSYRKFPNAVSALHAHYMNFDEEGNLLPYNDWDQNIDKPIGVPSFRLFATGAGGILYPPHIFPAEISNEKLFMNLCPNADDVWFKIMAVMNKIPTVLAAPSNELRYVDGTQDERLWSTNIFENDGQISAALDYFRDYKIEDKNIEKFIYDSDRDFLAD